VTRGAGLLRLAGWATGIVVALAALAASGHGALSPPPLGSPGRWQAWFDQREPATAAFAILRTIAIGGCWYVAATTLVGAVLRLLRADLLVAVADRFTAAPIRRFLAGSITLTLAGLGPTGMLAAAAQPAPTTTATTSPSSSTSGPALASTLASTSTTSTPTTTTTSTSTSTTAGPTSPDTITMRRLPPPGAPPEQTATQPAVPSAEHWTVQPGDCFWTIADDLLGRAWGRAPTDAEIVPYWLRLIEANRSELADPDNPHLIFPGQVFSVPPLPVATDAR